MNTLEEICERKRAHVRDRKSYYSLDDLKYKIAEKPLPCGFLCKLMMAEGPALIAEVKKASPSKGVIREDFDPVSIAKAYKEAGASCLSVLTDEPYFQGRDEYLTLIKEELNIPVLRKDFIVDIYQIYESRALGADCILLIMAALSDLEARRFYETALELRMDILVEVHDLPELERALRLDPMMVGVNNRNLKTLEVDLNTSFNLAMRLPSSVYKVSESGIGTHDTIKRLNSVGYRGFLVGESLMRQPDISLATRTLLGR